MPYASVIDGSGVGYGTQLLTFSTTVGPFVAEDFTVDRPFIQAGDEKSDGTPKNTRYTVDRITGTATIQAPSGTSGWPAFSETFTLTVDDNYGAETFILMPTPYAATNSAGDLRKINITFAKQNTSTLTRVNAAAN